MALFGIVAIVALSSCSKNDVTPAQKEIETKIIGKWSGNFTGHTSPAMLRKYIKAENLTVVEKITDKYDSLTKDLEV